MKQTDLFSYYNTTHVCGNKLAEYESKANHQELEVIAIFKMHKPGTELSPDEVHDYMVEENLIPLTSTRRAITTLTKKNVLEKTKTQRMGRYGRLTYCWKLKD